MRDIFIYFPQNVTMAREVETKEDKLNENYVGVFMYLDVNGSPWCLPINQRRTINPTNFLSKELVNPKLTTLCCKDSNPWTLSNDCMLYYLFLHHMPKTCLHATQT
jgi:hypothetical protein